jgi:hypothetical protein
MLSRHKLYFKIKKIKCGLFFTKPFVRPCLFFPVHCTFVVTGKRFKYIGTYKAPKDTAVRGAPKKLYIKLVHSFGLESARLTVGKYSGSQP